MFGGKKRKKEKDELERRNTDIQEEQKRLKAAQSRFSEEVNETRAKLDAARKQLQNDRLEFERRKTTGTNVPNGDTEKGLKMENTYHAAEREKLKKDRLQFEREKKEISENLEEIKNIVEEERVKWQKETQKLAVERADLKKERAKLEQKEKDLNRKGVRSSSSRVRAEDIDDPNSWISEARQMNRELEDLQSEFESQKQDIKRRATSKKERYVLSPDRAGEVADLHKNSSDLVFAVEVQMKMMQENYECDENLVQEWEKKLAFWRARHMNMTYEDPAVHCSYLATKYAARDREICKKMEAIREEHGMFYARCHQPNQLCCKMPPTRQVFLRK